MYCENRSFSPVDGGTVLQITRLLEKGITRRVSDAW